MVKANRQPIGVSTHSRPKAAAPPSQRPIHPPNVSTHSRPKAAAIHRDNKNWQRIVSTHSRPKAAAPDISAVANYRKFQHTAARRRLRLLSTFKEFTSCFNTQPPEGGCKPPRFPLFAYHRFNTQPPEGGCFMLDCFCKIKTEFQHTAARAAQSAWISVVSTHSRPKAAAPELKSVVSWIGVSTHSRPKAAAQNLNLYTPFILVSTHSRPKAAACHAGNTFAFFACFNTQPPEGGCNQFFYQIPVFKVSTHSRPKAAAPTPTQPL